MSKLKSEPKEIEISLKDAYKKWPEFRKYLISIGCNKSDAEDIFQEALLVYSRKLSIPEFELTAEPYHYIKGVCRLIWYNQSRKNSKNRKVDYEDDIIIEDDDWFQKEMKLQRIEQAISKIGQQCQQLLNMFYNLGKSMREIAQKLDLRNDKVAKVQKYRCINKVKDIIRSQNV